jgi:hypothetical protein
VVILTQPHAQPGFASVPLFVRKITGPRQTAYYCSASCGQHADQQRKWCGEGPSAAAALAEDLAHIRVREWLRKEIWAMFVQAMLVTP